MCRRVYDGHMTKQMHEWIKDELGKTPGLTQRGLAEVLSVNPSAVNRMIHGQRKIKVDEISLIENYLGQHFSHPNKADALVVGASERDAYASLSASAGHTVGFSDQSAMMVSGMAADFSQVPVYRVEKKETGVTVLSENDIIDWVVRHPFQNGIEGCFSLYVFDDTMEPRYFMNELIYLHPGRPPEIGKDCLIVFDDNYVMLAQFLGENRHQVEFKCYNRKKTFAFPRVKIKSLHSIVGRG